MVLHYVGESVTFGLSMGKQYENARAHLTSLLDHSESVWMWPTSATSIYLRIDFDEPRERQGDILSIAQALCEFSLFRRLPLDTAQICSSLQVESLSPNSGRLHEYSLTFVPKVNRLN